VKRLLVPPALGLLIAVLVAATVIQVSNDLRFEFVVGALALLAGGLLLGSLGCTGWWAWLTLCLPLGAAAGYAIWEAKGSYFGAAWPQWILWGLAGLVGLSWGQAGRRRRAALGTAILATASIGYAIWFLPAALSRTLNRVRDEPAPELGLASLDGRPLPASSWRGKVVVLDFFQTWCGPCLAELPQIERARAELEGRGDIEFYLVASEQGDDTPEALRSFVERRRLRLRAAFDRGGKAHDALGFVGVPALAVLDRSGKIRLTRVGYNAAEGDFHTYLVRFLSGL